MHKRRLRWLGIVSLLNLLLGAKAAQQLAMPSRAAAGMSEVSIVRTGGGVEAAVREAVARVGGLAGVVAPGDTVAIKVNLVMDAPASSGMVTDPTVARAVVRLAREAGAAQVLIVEGTAQYREGDPNRDRFATRAAFRAAGYDADGDMVDDATGAPLVDLNDSGGTDVTDPAQVSKVTVPTGLIRKEYWLPNEVLHADVLISVPVLKNHYLAGLTLGMKNLIGLLPADLYHGPGNVYGKHSLSHSPIDLDQHIVDLNMARRPDFVVADGQRGMLDGPIGSQIIDPPLGLVLAGRDVVAVDTVGTLVVGYDPRAIPYLQMAAQNGLGQADTSHIRIVGPPLDQVRREFPAPYADSPAQRADAQPPSVALLRPEGNEWQGVVTVVGQVADNDQVVRLELYVDQERVAQILAPPFEFTLDTEQYSPGRHLVGLVAFDRSLNQSSSSREVDFVVAPTGTPPATHTSMPPPTATPASPTATALPTEASPTTRPPTQPPAGTRGPAASPPTATLSAAPPVSPSAPPPEQSTALATQAPALTQITTPAATSGAVAQGSEPSAQVAEPRPAQAGASSSSRRTLLLTGLLLVLASLALIALLALVWVARRPG